MSTTTRSVRPECPACCGDTILTEHDECHVCDTTGSIEAFSDLHALARAGGAQIIVEDGMAAIRAPSFAHYGPVGVDLPEATLRWILTFGPAALRSGSA